MRIAIPSLPSDASVSLQALLEEAGHLIASDFPSYTVTLRDSADYYIAIDVPDSRFGRLLTHRIAEFTDDGVLVKAKGGNLNDKAAIIDVPNRGDAVSAVCVGILRALDQIRAITTQPAKDADKPLYNVSELLGSAVEAVKAHIGAMHERDMDRFAAFDAVLKERHEQQLSHGRYALQDAHRSTHKLFADLMAYYTRPRWWQWRYWR